MLIGLPTTGPGSWYLHFPVIFFCLVSQTPSPCADQKEFESIEVACVGLDIIFIYVSNIMTCYFQVSFLDLNSTKISIYYWYSDKSRISSYSLTAVLSKFSFTAESGSTFYKSSRENYEQFKSNYCFIIQPAIEYEYLRDLGHCPLATQAVQKLETWSSQEDLPGRSFNNFFHKELPKFE